MLIPQMVTNFLKKLIKHLAPDVFRPEPAGLLYLTYQAISREISGECPWDTSENCYKGYDTNWSVKCRNSLCPGYRNPLGLIAYTSRSSLETDQAPIVTPVNVGEYLSTDNRFDYSSFRFGSTLPSITDPDWIPIGTLGAEIKFDFGSGEGDLGGFGALFFGGSYFGNNGVSILTGANVVIGDKWYVKCVALTGDVGPAIPDPANTGVYSTITTRTGYVVGTRGSYSGIHDTVYTIQIIDFWGYIQNFENALLQINLATASEEWLDYWGDYFGIPRVLLVVSGNYIWETDTVYRARIMKEITRAKGTKPVLLEEAINYFNDPDVQIIEYQKPPLVQGYATGGSVSTLVDTGVDFVAAGVIVGLQVLNVTTGYWSYVTAVGINTLFMFPFGGFSAGDQYSVIGAMDNYNDGLDPDDPEQLRRGLWPYQFYIYPPPIRKPSAKWVKTGSNMMVSGISPNTAVYTQESMYYYGGYGYGYGDFTLLSNVQTIDEVCNWLFVPPGQVGDSALFGSKYLFGGLRIVLCGEIIRYADDPPAPPPPTHYWGGGRRWDEHVSVGAGVGGTYVWEYWNGIGWTTMTVTDTTTVGGTEFAQDGWVNWDIADDWAKADAIAYQIPNTGQDMYWIRCRVVVPPTTIPNVDYVGIVYASSKCRGCYCATQDLPLSVAKQPIFIGGSSYDGSNIYLTDPNRDFAQEGVAVGDTVIDITDQSSSTITSISTTPLATPWEGTHAYILNSVVQPIVPNGYVYICTVAGLSGGVEPVWPIIVGNTVGDGGVTWMCISQNNTLNFGALPVGSFTLGTLYGVTKYFRPSMYDTIPPGGGVFTTHRDTNNIYIYFGDNWERPDWSKLQDIIDRLKTAGTICIINPRFGG